MGIDTVSALDEGVDGLYGHTQSAWSRCAWNLGSTVLGIQSLQFVQGNATQVAHLLQIQVTVHHNSVGSHWQTGRSRAYIVLAIVVHHIVCCNEGRNIAACLLWQIRIDLPVVALSASTLDGLADIAWSAIVGRYNKSPVAEYLVKTAEHACSGITGLDGVAAVVNETGNLEVVTLARSEHELPQTGSTHATGSTGIQCALYDWQVFQFQRKLVCLEGILENGYIEIACPKHYCHMSAQAPCILVYELAHHGVIGHLYHIGQILQTANILFRFALDILTCTLARSAVVCQIGTGTPLAHHTVQFLLEHALRQTYGFLLSGILVKDGNILLR